MLSHRGAVKCYQCNENGHFAKKCTVKVKKEDKTTKLMKAERTSEAN